jgi:hypothetical protein
MFFFISNNLILIIVFLEVDAIKRGDSGRSRSSTEGSRKEVSAAQRIASARAGGEDCQARKRDE